MGSLLAGGLESARLRSELEAQNRVLEARVAERTADLLAAMTEAQEARAAAELANEAKSRFLANVSHELRTPLTSVVGFARLNRKRLDEVVFPVVARDDPRVDRAVRQVGDNLGIIVEEGERLTGLINDLLDLAKIEAGRIEWRMAPIRLEEVVRRALAATSALFEVGGVALEERIADGLPEVTGDEERLVQVVINLVSNAVKFSPGGRVTVTVDQVDRTRAGLRRRHREGHPRDGPRADLRTLPAGVGHPARRPARDRPRAAHRAPDRAGPRRRPAGELGARRGQHVLVHGPGIGRLIPSRSVPGALRQLPTPSGGYRYQWVMP